MKIAGLIKNSFVDFRGKVAAVIFTPGCNFNCYFCHNRDIIEDTDSLPSYSEEDIFSYINKRKNLLDGIVISGGEPTIQNDLPLFLAKLSKINLPVKLDTNGTNPEILAKLIENNLIHSVSMDIKAPYEKYSEICGVKAPIEKIRKSIDLLINSNLEYEFRTTVIPELDIDDLLEISRMIHGCKRYVLQQYKPQERHRRVIDLRSVKSPHKPSFFHDAKIVLEKELTCVEIKGIT